jgi:hypothetical protein
MLKSRGEMGEPWGVPDTVRPSRQHLAVTDPFGHPGHQGFVIKIAEGIRDVSFEHPVGTPVRLDPHRLQGVVHAAPWAVAEARRQEVRFPDGLQEQLCRRHDRSVPTGRYAERPELARLPGLGDADSPQGSGPVGPLPEIFGDVFEEGVHPGGLDVAAADVVDTGRPSVWHGPRSRPRQACRCGRPCRKGHGTCVQALAGTAVEHVGEGSGPGWAASPVSSGISHVRHSPLPSLQLRASVKWGPSLVPGCAARWSSLLRPPDSLSAALPFLGSAGYGQASLPVPLGGRWSSARPDDRATHGPPVTLMGSVAAACWFGGLGARRHRHLGGRGRPLQLPGQPSGRSTPITPESPGHPLQVLGCRPWPSPIH